MPTLTTRRTDLILPELSYQVVGALFDVWNELGGGHLEKMYQRAVARALEERGVKFQEQIPIDLSFHGGNIGKYLLDFLVEEKLIVELKQGNGFRRGNIEQTKSYLRATHLSLVLLANFTTSGVKYMRILNVDGVIS